MRARHTVSCAISRTSTLTWYSAISCHSTFNFAGVAMALKSVVAFLRYSTYIPFRIQEWVLGTLASVMVPAASSARLHMAIAWIVSR